MDRQRKLSLIAAFVLLIGIFGAVVIARQIQDTRSRAAGFTQGTYGYGVYGGGVYEGSELTATPGANIAFSLLLHGIGLAGDSASPNTQGNMHPAHPERMAKIEVFDGSNTLVHTGQTKIAYASESGSFKGALGVPLNGLYTVKIKTDKYLRVLSPGIQKLAVGQTVNLSPIAMIVGDINGDNAINIIDYNILAGCYSDLLPAVNCSDANKFFADLDDDGKVNQYDYNLFLRELQNQSGH